MKRLGAETLPMLVGLYDASDLDVEAGREGIGET